MYRKLLRYYIEQSRWASLPAEDVRRLQTIRFRKLFEHARAHSFFYRRLYREAGVDKLEIRVFDDIQKVPIVDKKMMRACAPEEILTRPLTTELVLRTTSGSTGEPFRVYQTPYEEYTAHVRTFAMLTALGYRPWQRILMLTRQEQASVFPVEKDLSVIRWMQQAFPLFRREIRSIYTSPAEIAAWLESRRDSGVLWSTPGIMDILREHLEANTIRFEFPLVVLTSETLSDLQRERIATCMGKRVVSHYGLMECPTIGADSGTDGRQHIFPNACLMQVIGVRQQDGVPQGEAVITNLVNYTMPFIRYNTHDTAVVPEDADFPTKVIGPIRGRADDVLSLPGGGKLAHHHAHEMFMDFEECLQFKFVQSASGETILRLRIRDHSQQQNAIEKAQLRWKRRFPAEPIRIEIVGTMPVDPRTGKVKNIERLD